VLDFSYEARPELAKFAFFGVLVLADPTHLGLFDDLDGWVIFTCSRSLKEGGLIDQCYCLSLDMGTTPVHPLVGDETQRVACHRISVPVPQVDSNRPASVA